MYILDEEKIIVNGAWEGYLEYANVNKGSILIYAGTKFTGKRLSGYSVVNEFGKTKIRVSGSDGPVYITYEVLQDEKPIIVEKLESPKTPINEKEIVYREYVDIALAKVKQEILQQIKKIESEPGVGLDFSWNGTQLGVKKENETEYEYIDLQGPEGPKGDKGSQGIQGIPGENGKSVEFHWNGTQLGIRIEGQTSYQYVNLQGLKGDTGDTGTPGQDGNDGISLEYHWDGTRLGIKKEDEVNYQYTNLEGPRGIQGEQGERGPQGTQGEIGPQGERGLQGPKGDKGDTGSQGAKGDTGLQGIQGEVGPKGDIGPKGDKGDQGIQGVKGEQGLKGDKGDDGYTPIKGIDYFDGIQGPKGDTGDTGLQGPSGADGSDAAVTNANVIYAIGYTPANANKEHTHPYKDVIDKFTEVDGKPYYNGSEIGGGLSGQITWGQLMGGES